MAINTIVDRLKQYVNRTMGYCCVRWVNSLCHGVLAINDPMFRCRPRMLALHAGCACLCCMLVLLGSDACLLGKRASHNICFVNVMAGVYACGVRSHASHTLRTLSYDGRFEDACFAYCVLRAGCWSGMLSAHAGFTRSPSRMLASHTVLAWQVGVA